MFNVIRNLFNLICHKEHLSVIKMHFLRLIVWSRKHTLCMLECVRFYICASKMAILTSKTKSVRVSQKCSIIRQYKTRFTSAQDTTNWLYFFIDSKDEHFCWQRNHKLSERLQKNIVSRTILLFMFSFNCLFNKCMHIFVN